MEGCDSVKSRVTHHSTNQCNVNTCEIPLERGQPNKTHNKTTKQTTTCDHMTPYVCVCVWWNEWVQEVKSWVKWLADCVCGKKNKPSVTWHEVT
jgi:hypothetical protein